MTTELVHYVLEGTTAVLTMDDGKANALSHPMMDALFAALDRAEREASAIVVTGRPDKFCAGFDLKVMNASPAAAVEMLGRGAELFMRFYGTPLPLVIACTGHALAGGAMVVMTGDLRIGTHGAYRIGMNEVTIGLPIPVLAMELARDRIVASELSNATLMAKIYDPEHAVRAGLLDEVVTAPELRGRAIGEASRLGVLPRNAYSGTKTRLRGQTIAHIRTTLAADLAQLLA